METKFSRISTLLLFILVLHYTSVLSLSPVSSPSHTLSRSHRPEISNHCGLSLRGNWGEERLRTPWTALLFQRNKQTNGVHVDWIGGVVVGPFTIITRGRQFWAPGTSAVDGGRTRPQMNGLAAENFLVGVGIPNRKEFEPDEFTQILEVDYIRPHPRSYEEHSEYDFAIVQLKSKISFSTKVNAICVPSPRQADKLAELTPDPNDFAPPRHLSGFQHWVNYSLLTTDYVLKPSDVCNATCLASPQTPSSSAAQLQSGGPPCPPTARQRIGTQAPDFSNFFLVGSLLSSWISHAWYFTGLVTKSYGCHKRAGVSHFISPIASRITSLVWIHANIRNGGQNRYACLDGQTISLTRLCNGRVDCLTDGDSDEEPAFCEAWGCGQDSLNTERCQFDPKNGTAAWKVRNGPDSYIEVPRLSSSSRKTNQSAPATGVRVQLVVQIFPPQPSSLSSAYYENVTAMAPARASCPPLWLTDEVVIDAECSAAESSKVNDCRTRQHPGTKMRLACRPKYKPSTSSTRSFTEWKCGLNGEWGGRAQPFSCIVPCGGDGDPSESAAVPVQPLTPLTVRLHQVYHPVKLMVDAPIELADRRIFGTTRTHDLATEQHFVLGITRPGQGQTLNGVCDTHRYSIKYTSVLKE